MTASGLISGQVTPFHAQSKTAKYPVMPKQKMGIAKQKVSDIEYMNHHLNIFRFFNESTKKESVENNLSRAFSICLTNNSFFLNEYIQAIVTEEDYEYLFSSISEDTKYSINIQVDTATIEKESFSKIYAVAMTSDKDLVMDDFFQQPEFGNEKNITDIIISIKDIAIIIEVSEFINKVADSLETLIS